MIVEGSACASVISASPAIPKNKARLCFSKLPMPFGFRVPLFSCGGGERRVGLATSRVRLMLWHENVETDPYDSDCGFGLRGDCCRRSVGSGGYGKREKGRQGQACFRDGLSDSSTGAGEGDRDRHNLAGSRLYARGDRPDGSIYHSGNPGAGSISHNHRQQRWFPLRQAKAFNLPGSTAPSEGAIGLAAVYFPRDEQQFSRLSELRLVVFGLLKNYRQTIDITSSASSRQASRWLLGSTAAEQSGCLAGDAYFCATSVVGAARNFWAPSNA